MPKRNPVEIGVVVYPQVQLAAVHGLIDLFTIANRIAAKHGVRNGGLASIQRMAPACTKPTSGEEV